MRFSDRYSGNVFIGSSDNFKDSKAVIFGAPMDWTSSYRSGSRLGPARIREASLVHEEYSHYLKRDLSDIKYYDAGDIPLSIGNPQKSLEEIRQFVCELLSYDKIPFALGGEHLVTWPIVDEVYKKYKDLVVIHIDAHADLRLDYEGEPYSHSVPLRRITELIGGSNLYQFGIRSMTKDEVEYADEKGINFYPFEVLKPLKECLKDIGDKPVYLTIDIDALDPAYAPGTGTPDPGGISSREILRCIHEMKNTNIVGADIVEVSPPYDQSERTSILAAKMLREMLLSFYK